MFQKKDNRGQQQASQKQAAPSILSADLVVNGNLVSDGDMQVDGTVEGDITSKKLTISSTAVVRGSIEADAIVIAGAVTGQVKARHVTLSKTARVIADVVQERLTIEPGAFFEGNCRHFPDEKPVEKKALERIGAKPELASPSVVGGAKPATATATVSDAKDKESHALV
ncbi:polymer-forming cytoskeletal protein [Nisaea sp.]|uniref:bactofilin family protein n=1 Tax=Nisaea sp. TaxID=2024842 RepID=UPI002B2772FF|nr:polymer-forming cytoskeletal protein [Nisaea sp.]